MESRCNAAGPRKLVPPIVICWHESITAMFRPARASAPILWTRNIQKIGEDHCAKTLEPSTSSLPLTPKSWKYQRESAELLVRPRKNAACVLHKEQITYLLRWRRRPTKMQRASLTPAHCFSSTRVLTNTITNTITVTQNFTSKPKRFELEPASSC